MKERGILMSAPMVLAILSGSKTQTRRTITDTGHYAIDEAIHGQEVAARERLAMAQTSRFGVPGDRLWIREAWRAEKRFDHLPPREIPQGTGYFCEASRTNWEGGPHDGEPGRLRPSMFMPRWVSRITLEITEVRVERLQDISEADCQAEGIESYALNGKPSITSALNLPAAYYRYLWNSINGEGSWDLNPWIWCLSFKRIF